MRYRIIAQLPAGAQSRADAPLADGAVRLHMSIADGELTVVATGEDARACERLLKALGATEIGVELCG